MAKCGSGIWVLMVKIQAAGFFFVFAFLLKLGAVKSFHLCFQELPPE